MSLIDHVSLPCPSHLVSAEIAFLTTAFSCIGLHEITRPVAEVVGLGVRGSSAGKVVEEDGTNNVFLWVFGDGAPGREAEKGKGMGSVHLAMRVRSELCPNLRF